MFTPTKSEQITQLLNEWYIEIRLRRIDSANRFKEQIDNKINILKTNIQMVYLIKTCYSIILY